MKLDKEIDREINQFLISNAEIGWLKEEQELIRQKIEKNNNRIRKLQRNIRGIKKRKQLIEQFDNELDMEFESIYG